MPEVSGRVRPQVALQATAPVREALEGGALMARHFSDGLTAKQRACYEMRKNGSSWKEIATALELSPQSARAHVEAAERNGAETLPRHSYGGRAPGLPADPGAANRISNALGGVFDTAKFLEMAGAAGIPPRIAQGLARRIQMNLGPVRQELKRMSLTEQVEATNAKAQLVLSYIDDTSIAGLSAKDLAMAYGILVDKALVLGGRPNVIVDFNARRRLEQLMPEFISEARRRGVTIDASGAIVKETVVIDGSDDADASGTQANS